MKHPSQMPSLAQLLVLLAIAVVLSSGTAYAAKQISGKNIKNNSVTTRDIRNGTLTGADVADGSLTTSDLLLGPLTGANIADGSLTAADLARDAVGASQLQDDSVGSSEVKDFDLTNQDVGVLFAQVSATGTLDNSSGGGVTVTKLAGGGNYEVDFGRDISHCAFVATIGPSGAGSAAGEVTVADRSGNVEAVFVDTNTSSGAAADQPFQLVVVC